MRKNKVRDEHTNNEALGLQTERHNDFLRTTVGQSTAKQQRMELAHTDMNTGEIDPTETTANEHEQHESRNDDRGSGVLSIEPTTRDRISESRILRRIVNH
jgi:hypothetical protein